MLFQVHYFLIDTFNISIVTHSWKELDCYSYCGYSRIMEKLEGHWQNTEAVFDPTGVEQGGISWARSLPRRTGWLFFSRRKLYIHTRSQVRPGYLDFFPILKTKNIRAISRLWPDHRSHRQMKYSGLRDDQSNRSFQGREICLISEWKF